MSSMDSFFLLGAEARGRFLQIAGRVLGCTYICTWSPLYDPASNHLISTDGWHHEEDSGYPSSSSSGSISLRLFDAYRRSICTIQNGCVPGLAYSGGLTYMERRDAHLINSTSMHVQRQFYQEAGIKTAIFVGCRSGEFELGMNISPYMNMQTNVLQVFTEDFIQLSQSQLGEDIIRPSSQLRDPLMQQPHDDRSRLSSSSSSFRSLSVGSPESSPRLLTTEATASSFNMPETVTEGQALVPPYQMFATPTGTDDEAMTRALMLAVVSSTTTPSCSSPVLRHQQALQHLHQAYQGRGTSSHGVGAFRAYTPLQVLEAEPHLPGQRMIKTGIDILRRMSLMRMEARMQEYRPTSNQLHHMISERRRREKLNENFHALRLLLPSGSKKDKTSVLANTKNYLNSLKAQISELEERNRMLQMRLQRPAAEEADDDNEDGDSNERVQVRISRSSESTSEAQQINLRLIVREECDIMDVIVHVLEYLRRMRGATMVSMSTSMGSPQQNIFARASLRLQVKASDWDEESFKEAVTEAVIGVLARRATATP